MSNAGGEFENFREHYPTELELEKKNDISRKVSFSDLRTKIRENKFSLNLYDKRDDFLFATVRRPYLLSSIIFAKIFYSASGAENLRTARLVSTFNKFTIFSKALRNRAQYQDGNPVVLKRKLFKYFGCHFDVSKVPYIHKLPFWLNENINYKCCLNYLPTPFQIYPT